ncbi:hypothetical protein E0E50_15245 [Azotobacter chroococcum subsp. isscasi]|nr:hypothetical protein E0E50_15245 [Azotobacter chroococcum subsp. isscasi]
MPWLIVSRTSNPTRWFTARSAALARLPVARCVPCAMREKTLLLLLSWVMPGMAMAYCPAMCMELACCAWAAAPLLVKIARVFIDRS